VSQEKNFDTEGTEGKILETDQNNNAMELYLYPIPEPNHESLDVLDSKYSLKPKRLLAPIKQQLKPINIKR